MLAVPGIGTYIAYHWHVCGLFLYGVDASELTERNGLVYYRGESHPFTGTAHATLIAEEGGFLHCPPVRWRAQFRDGRLDGRFDAPIQGIGEDKTFLPGETTQVWIYDSGRRVGGGPSLGDQPILVPGNSDQT